MNLAAISRFVLAHKRMVVVTWVIVFVVSIALLKPSLDQLSQSFAQPGTESYDANVTILSRFQGVGGLADPVVPVVHLPDGVTVDDPGVKDDLNAALADVQRAVPTARIASWASTGDDAFVSADRSTTFALIYLPNEGFTVAGLDAVEGALQDVTVGGAKVLVTGTPVLSAGGDSGGAGVLVEILIGGTGALLVLIFVFGSFLALLPLLMAAISILASFLVIGGVASFTEISFIVQFLVSLIGLGVAIDYSLLVVTRWREERESGIENEMAVQRAMETAGHAVVFSGTTVGVGLLALAVLPVPLLRGIGIGGMVIPLVSVIVTITLLPVILATIGPKVDWPRGRRGIHKGHGWERWTGWVVAHHWVSTIIALAILGLLLIPAFQIKIGTPRPDALSGTPPAEAALQYLEDSGINAGVLSPFETVVQGADPSEVASAISDVDGVRGAVAPEGENWRHKGIALVPVMIQSNGSGSEADAMLDPVRNAAHQVGDNVLVGGQIATGGDFVDKAYGSLPIMILIISFVTFVLLVRAFRSLVLPIKAIVLNIISIGASYGIVVMIWQWGWGSEVIWGIPASGSITDWVPIAAFAFLFGLSMDYEVFILTRVREEYDKSGDNDGSIVRGLGFVGRLVTSAALILFFAFAALAAGPQTEIKIMATALAAGILLDATVVRAFLVPALVSLMGHWNWWLPSWLQWLAPEPEPITGDTETDQERSVP